MHAGVFLSETASSEQTKAWAQDWGKNCENHCESSVIRRFSSSCEY